MVNHAFSSRQIFRPGCKVVLGSGLGQEERFVTAVVAAAQSNGGGGEGRGDKDDYGGMLILEKSLEHNHAEGARVSAVRPSRVEGTDYDRRQVNIYQAEYQLKTHTT